MPISDGPSKSQKLLIAVLSAVIAIGVIGFGTWYAMQEKIVITNSELTQERKFEMSEMKGAANSFRRVGQYKNAQNLYVTVLTEFDCHDAESRQYLEELDKKVYTEIIANCPEL